MFFAKRTQRIPPQADNPYWMSFSDMMSGLLIIFILVCMALLLKLSQMKEQVTAELEQMEKQVEIKSNELKQMEKQVEIKSNELKQMEKQIEIMNAELNKANKIRNETLHDIKNELSKKGIEVIIDNDTLHIPIAEKKFHFETGSYEITEEMCDTARSIGEAVYTKIKKDERWKYLDTVFVEGHADSRDAPNFPMGNWGLSAFRAISLWQFWLKKTKYGPELEKLKNQDGKHLFSISGYGDKRLINEREPTDKSNRRIDIRFTTRQSSSAKSQDVSKTLPGE